MRSGIRRKRQISKGQGGRLKTCLPFLRMSRKKKMTLGIILLSIALLVCLCPVISNFTAVKYQSIVQTRYEKAVSNMDDTELQKAKEAALAYNRTLIPGVADNLSFSEEALKSAAENYENLLNIRGDGIMGYVEIPKIDVNLPIYHGTGDDSLDRGVGHLLGSSLPVGGETSHTVLTAHSDLADLITVPGVEILSFIPADSAFAANDIKGKSVLELPADSAVLTGVKDALQKIEIL